MIKGITWIRPVGSPDQFEELVSFFSTLGFEPGRSWDDRHAEPGLASKGRPFLAPLGNLEFVNGVPPAVTSDLLIEVTQLDDLHLVAQRWLDAHPRQEAAGERITRVDDTHWNSRLFTVHPIPGFSLAFWESADPLRGKPVALEGDLSAAGMRFAVVVARWNAVITERLLQGALDALLRSGAKRSDIQIARVPGSWEIPGATRQFAATKNYDGVIALGCLIRGETAHYEAIYTEVARGIGQSQQETGVPHAFGVLTCETLEQALDRAGLKSGNKGFEAATAAIEMVSLYRRISERSGPSATALSDLAGRRA
jgi:6,7-dimethyl-8-ribityllumazine synthase